MAQTSCKHISLAQPSEFDLHRPASFSEMVDILETAHRQEGWSNTRLQELGKACGITYDPYSIIFDKSLRSVINPIDNTYWDWMHGLVASGVLPNWRSTGSAMQLSMQGLVWKALTSSMPRFHGPVRAAGTCRHNSSRSVLQRSPVATSRLLQQRHYRRSPCWRRSQ